MLMDFTTVGVRRVELQPYGPQPHILPLNYTPDIKILPYLASKMLTKNKRNCYLIFNFRVLQWVNNHG